MKNETTATKTARVFSYVEWCLWNAEDDATNLQRNLSLAECLVNGSTICHVTGYRERRNHYGFHLVNRAVDGFDTDRSAFLGAYGDCSDPAVVRARRSGNSRVSGWWPIASFSLTVTLRPGESTELVFATGFAENAVDDKWTSDGTPNVAAARRLSARLQDARHAERAFGAHRGRWDSWLDSLQVQTPDARLDELVNTWNPYQCMVTFQLARSASLFETGRGRGIGFRDSNQDCLGVVHMVPDEVRTRLVHLAATQKSDGSAYHQYQPLTRSGNAEIGDGFNDDPLWLVLSVAAYVRETGRADLLDAAVPFEDAPDGGATMRDHLEASLRYTLARLGSHGLPLIGRADWNDCLNLNAHSTNPDESFQTAPMRTSGRAESVMIAALFVLAAREYATLATALQDDAAAAKYRAAADAMAATVEAHGWDGEWFLRAYDHAGRAVGSAGNDEGQIFLEPQALCAMAGIGAAAGLVDRALASVSDAPRLPVWRAAARPAVSQLPRRAGRDLDLPAWLQGKRLGVLPHQSVAHHRRGDARPRRPGDAGAALDCADVPVGSGHAPHRALRLRTDGRRSGGGESRRGQEFVAHGHGVLVAHGRDAAHPGPARFLRGARRRSLHSRGVAVLQHAPGVPRRALRDRGAKRPRQRPRRSQPRRRRQGRPRQCHSPGGGGLDGPGDGRARLNMGDTLELGDGRWRVTVAPSLGGSLLACTFDDVPVLHPVAQAAVDGRTPVRCCHFPLIPFSNRVENGRFSFNGSSQQLARNVAGSPHAMHGHGWQVAWQVAERRDASCALTYEREPTADWPWRYRGRQTIAVAGDALRLTLAIENLGPDAMPCGLGFHPFLPRSGGARLELEAARVWNGEASDISDGSRGSARRARFPGRAAGLRAGGNRSLLRRLEAPRDGALRERPANARARGLRVDGLCDRLHPGGRRLFLRRAGHPRGERRGIRLGIGGVDAIDARPLEQGVAIHFRRAQRSPGIGGEEGIAGAGGKDNRCGPSPDAESPAGG